MPGLVTMLSLLSMPDLHETQDARIIRLQHVNNSHPGAIANHAQPDQQAVPSAISSLSSQLTQQVPYPLVDVVADGPDRRPVQACGVGQIPVEVSLSRAERARVPATHGDDYVGGLNLVAGERCPNQGYLNAAHPHDQGKLAPGTPDGQDVHDPRRAADVARSCVAGRVVRGAGREIQALSP
jgi:hypothetical protein